MRTVPGRTASELTEPQWPATEDASLAATGEMPATDESAPLGEHPLLEDVIPQIYHLAQHVGGLKHLAEIIAQLQRGEPE